jgi:hypothetical protein
VQILRELMKELAGSEMSVARVRSPSLRRHISLARIFRSHEEVRSEQFLGFWTLDPVIFYPKHCFSPMLKNTPRRFIFCRMEITLPDCSQNHINIDELVHMGIIHVTRLIGHILDQI